MGQSDLAGRPVYMEVPAFTPSAPSRVAIACGVIVCVSGILVFSGWLFDVDAIRSVRAGWPRMAPATALGFALSGAALWLIAAAGEAAGSIRLAIARIAAAATAIIGTATLVRLGLGLPFEFDTLGFTDDASVPPATAADFVLVGAALWLARPRRSFALFQALALGSILVGALGLAGYLYGGGMLLPYAQMAIHTSPLFIVLGAGILCTRTDGGLLALLTSPTVGGRMALWMLLLVPPVPLAIAWLEGQAERSKWFGNADPDPLFALFDTIVVGALIWTAGAWLHRVDRRRAREEETRREQQTLLGLFVDYAPAAIAMLDRDMRYIAVSRRWLNDYRLADREIVGRSHYELFPETSTDWKAVHRRCLAGGSEKREGDSFPRADGSIDWLDWEIHPWHRKSGEVGGLVLFSEVVTERVQTTEKIRRLNRVYAVLRNINSLIVRGQNRQLLFDEACRIAVEHGAFGLAWIGLYYADAAEIRPVSCAGHAAGDPPVSPIDLSDGSSDARSVAALALRTQRTAFDNDITAPGKDETYRELVRAGYRSVAALPLVVDDTTVGIISVCTSQPGFFDEEELQLLGELAGDISFALQFLTKQEELDYISYFDVLTGLANRSLFLDRLKQRLHGIRSGPDIVALLLFDIERFSMMNHSFGRHGADQLLRLVARRLQDAAGGEEDVARIGPDKFALIVTDVQDGPAVAQRLEETLLPCFRLPFRLSDTELRISVRVGIAQAPADGGDAETLLRNAETAVKQAKAGGNRYLFYASDMNARAAEALSLETRLRRAVEAREFVLYYQPKISLGDGSIRGLEALIRWQHPETGLMPPARFVPILEQTGLIVEVGKWAVQQALTDFKSWASRGYPVPGVAVNMSPLQLRQKGFTAEIRDAIERAAVEAEALELEITETQIMRDINRSIRDFATLRAMGISIAIDDFGTGYSSLSYLSRLPVDKLKIDRSFIIGMLSNPHDMIVVSTIITLAHSFELPVVAEGVESDEQLRRLKELGCDEAQGYLFCEPLPPAEVEAMLAAPR